MELSAGSLEAFSGASAGLGSSNSTPSRDSSSPRVEELAGIGALRDGAFTLSKLGLVKANQATLMKVLQLVQVDTLIP
jgi:hypothetical protein